MGAMREYSIKRGHNTDLSALVEDYFGVRGNPEEGMSFTADGIGTIRLRRTGASLFIETEPYPDMTGGADAIKKWNDFLLEATGRTAKERKKMLEKKAKRK